MMTAVVVDLRVSERAMLCDVESSVASELDAKGSLSFVQQESQDDFGQRSVAPQATAHSTGTEKEKAELLILGTSSVGADLVAVRSMAL